MNTKAKGEITQGVVTAALLKAGLPVLIPFGDNQRYDLVVDVNGKFVRIQCKTARLKKQGSVVFFDACSSQSHRGKGKQSYKGQVDFFGVYCHELDKIYMVPSEHTGNFAMQMRLLEPKTTNQRKAHYAKDYEWFDGKVFPG